MLSTIARGQQGRSYPQPELGCPDIRAAARAYSIARYRAEQLKALATLALLKSVFKQGFDAGQKAERNA